MYQGVGPTPLAGDEFSLRCFLGMALLCDGENIMGERHGTHDGDAMAGPETSDSG
jgi:hypothetical protein